MEARLSAIKRGLLLLLAASLMVAFFARPAPENRRLVHALDELTAFRKTFDRQAAEQSLLAQAAHEGEVSLQSLEAAWPTKRGPKLKVAQGVEPVRPFGVVSLATLSDVAAHSQPGSTITVGSLDGDALVTSLTWRLARTERNGVFTLKSVELVPAELTHDDVEQEKNVAGLRAASLDARAALEEITHRIEILEYRVEAQSKRRSKQLFKSRLALEEARQTLAERTQVRTDTQQRYDEAVQRAEQPRKTRELSGVPRAALARVKLSYGADEIAYEIPVPLVMHEVPVQPLRVTAFSATRTAELWDRVRGGDADAAIALVESRFNWHLHHVALLGVKLNGTILLQILPAILPCLMWLLLVSLRRAETAYSPFGTKVPTTPPSVGFENRFIEFIAIFVLPLAAVASAATALVLDARLPVGPALTGVACVALGVYAFTKVQEIREQTVSIVQSQSIPPPPAA